MLLEWRDQDNVEKGRRLGLEEGRKEGLARGLEKGREEGAESLAKLISALLSQGRTSDVARAASDPRERTRLAAELGIELPVR